jgi:hypothetical protein
MKYFTCSVNQLFTYSCSFWCNILFSSFADHILLFWSYRGNTRSNYRRFCYDLPKRGESSLSEYSLGVLVSFCLLTIIILGFYHIRRYICYIGQRKYGRSIICLVSMARMITKFVNMPHCGLWYQIATHRPKVRSLAWIILLYDAYLCHMYIPLTYHLSNTNLMWVFI